MSIQSLKDRVPTAAVPGRWPDNSICVQQIDTNDHIIVIVIFWCPVWRLTRSLCINKSRLGNWDVMYLVPLAGDIQYIHIIYIYIYRHKLPITHCCCSVSACMMMMSVFCLLPASAAVQFVACAHLPITGAEEQILSCLEIITTRLIFTTSGPLLENIQTPPIWRQRTRRRNKEKFSREKLHCN